MTCRTCTICRICRICRTPAQVGHCSTAVEVEGREGSVSCSLALLCGASPCLLRWVHTTNHSSPPTIPQHHTNHHILPHHCTTPPYHTTTSHQITQDHLTTPPRIVSRHGDTSSPLLPPGKVTLILPGFSTKAISSLLAFLATGVVTVDRPLLEEVGELAKVLELKEEMGRREHHKQHTHSE